MSDLSAMNDATLVLGASENPQRYANKAVHSLIAHGHAVVALGKRAGRIGAVPILTELPRDARIHTVTIYLSTANQSAWLEQVLALRPRRVIFNPGAENPAFARALQAQGVEVIEGCTLVMLATDQY